MTQEDKKLLLQDLSARLPYGVKLQCGGVLIGETHQRYMKERCDTTLYSITEVYDNCYVINGRYDLIEVKPYLRPMYSMTEEEFKEHSNHMNVNPILWFHYELDWLNKKMFDYRGLIEKGLAIKAPD